MWTRYSKVVANLTIAGAVSWIGSGATVLVAKATLGAPAVRRAAIAVTTHATKERGETVNRELFVLISTESLKRRFLSIRKVPLCYRFSIACGLPRSRKSKNNRRDHIKTAVYPPSKGRVRASRI